MLPQEKTNPMYNIRIGNMTKRAREFDEELFNAEKKRQIKEEFYRANGPSYLYGFILCRLY